MPYFPRPGIWHDRVSITASDVAGYQDTLDVLIHILQPPHVGNGYVSVFRGETAITSIYVEDSDKLSFSFNSPDGIEVKVVGEDPVREYDDYGQGGRYEEIQVSVDKDVKPGRYNVSVTAKDEANLEGSGDLVVEVRHQNHPPSFDPTSLSEERTVYYSGGGGLGHSRGQYLLISPS